MMMMMNDFCVCLCKGGLLSYSMPQGSKRGENWNFFDHTYDGVWEDNYLRNGLGQLTDGRNGPNNFKDDYYGHERGEFVHNFVG